NVGADFYGLLRLRHAGELFVLRDPPRDRLTDQHRRRFHRLLLLTGPLRRVVVAAERDEGNKQYRQEPSVASHGPSAFQNDTDWSVSLSAEREEESSGFEIA